jgi:hypothetical protein
VIERIRSGFSGVDDDLRLAGVVGPHEIHIESFVVCGARGIPV